MLLLAADELKLCDGKFKLPKGIPPAAAAPKDWKIGFVAVGNKAFNDVIETGEFCTPL